MNTKPNVKPLGFDEDNFDLAAHKKAADTVIREKSRIKRIHRHVAIGKILMAVAAVVIFFLVYYIIATTNFINLF